ncbi:MAG: cytochrome c [Rhizobiales bacterium]|nr:cytochrome c [Hyphomicrobiales bacterium]
MLRRVLPLLSALGIIGAIVGWFLSAPQPLASGDLPSHTASAENGEYIFAAAGCASCHKAKGASGDDKLLLSGGQRFETEFGTFIAPNISPDPDSGIGGWSDLQFVNAVMRGVSPGGSHYYPAFPYTSYTGAKTVDILDLKAYMDTLPKVAARAPEHEVGFPFNIRRGLGLWKLLFFKPEPFVADASKSEIINRGAYLVNTLGHCNECHTPRNAVGGLLYDKAFAGAPNPDGKGFIPNITPHADGMMSWAESDISYALESGFTPEFDSLGSSMGAVIENTAKLTAADRDAIAAYLKSVTPLPRTPKS